MMPKPTMFCRAALLACAIAGGAAQAAQTLPLPEGGQLKLDKQAMVLFDRAGAQRASLPMRAEQLDLRAGVAVVRDAATQHALLVRVDTVAGTLSPLPALPVQSFGVESLCLFRDQQGLDHLFIAGKDGQAEQWLLGAGAAPPVLVRKLSMPLDSGACKVDDATHTLYVDEPGVGRWAYEASAEAMPSRRLLKTGVTAKGRPADAIAVVQPQVQTDVVARLGDVADDPAIWIHPSERAQSRVLGTNKKQGLLVYDLQGRQQQFLDSGRLNNVDLRQGVLLDGQRFDLAVASGRDDNAIVLFGIDGAGHVTELSRIATGLPEVYGICLFRPRQGGLEVIVNDKSGAFRQFDIQRAKGRWTGHAVRDFKVASQPEGCVADDANQRLFIGEEKRGVWTLAARAGQSAAMTMVLAVGPHLKADVEGIAMYQGAKRSYLIVSSQGDNSYVVLDAAAPFKVRGRFRIGFNVAAGIDGASDTDGLDVTTADLGGPFRQGMLVVQDGYKRMPDGPQNFKYVAWADVAKALALP